MHNLVAEFEQPNNFNANVITQGSQWAAIWRMSWPLVLNLLVISLGGFADTWVAGQISAPAQAAVGMAYQVYFFFILLEIALSTGTTAVVSRYWGAGDFETAVEAARNSSAIALCFGLVSSAAGVTLSGLLFQIMGADLTVQQMAVRFMAIFALSLFPMTWIANNNALLRSTGDAKTPLAIWSLITAITVVGDYSLCIRPFHFGVLAIAVVALVATSTGMLSSCLLLRRTALSASLNLLKVTLHSVRLWAKRIFAIGIPASFQDVAWTGGNFFLFVIFAQTSNPLACQATWGIGMRVEEFIGMPIWALNLAVPPLSVKISVPVSQNEPVTLAGSWPQSAPPLA